MQFTNGSRSALGSLLLLIASGVATAQLPAHPRLLFTPSEKAALQAKIAVPGSKAAIAFSNLATSATLAQASALPNLDRQWAWDVALSMRHLVEVAFRYQMTGNASFASNARAMLLTCAQKLTPHAENAWRGGSYIISMSVAYDLIHDQLSVADRTTIKNHLETWMNVYRTGRSPITSYSAFNAATDNYTFGNFSAMVVGLLATAEDSSRPDPIGEAVSYLERMRIGWNDAYSPDGSYDEGYGYATYGSIYALWAAYAAERIGLGDYVSGTNVVRAPWFFGSTLVGDGYFWYGDASPTHRGTNIDPSIWMVVGRDGGALGTPPAEETVWALDRVFALSPPGNDTSCHGLSPHIPVILWYPQHITPRAPAITSGFFRDNRNEGTTTADSTAARFTAYTGIGRGGMAILQAQVRPDARTLSAFYYIKDEWTGHGHEDDGHISIAVGGVPMFIDLGASRADFVAAQSTNHSIVTCDGVSAFFGTRNNYYNPPHVTLDGVFRPASFGGSRQASFIGRGADYVRGDHRGMWQFERAERSVFMVKGNEFPYLMVLSDVARDSASRTYRERFHAAVGTSGAGTIQSPMIVSHGGQTMRSVWLSPQNFSLVRHNGTAVGAIGGWPVEAVASGPRVQFLSIHSADQVQSQAPLIQAAPGVLGARIQIGGFEDKLLAATDGAGVADAATTSDASFVWLRSSGAGLQSLFASEVSVLMHEGQRVFSASRPVSVSVRPGLVEVNSAEAAQGSALNVEIALSGITEVYVDGQAVPFTRTANGIAIGGTPAPAYLDDDRGYCFTGGFLWDAIADANVVIDAQDRFTSAAGWAQLRLFGDRSFGSRPIALGFEACPTPAAFGDIAGLHLGSVPGAGDVLRATVRAESDGSLSLRLSRQSTVYGTYPLSLRSTDGSVRLHLEVDPGTQILKVENAVGAEICRISVAPLPAAWYIRAMTTPMAALDEITVFDSAEDGVTPQGVAFYGMPSGQVGFFLRTPGLVQMQDLKPTFDGFEVDRGLAMLWWQNARISEMEISPYVYIAPVAIEDVKTAGFGSEVGALHTFSGARTGLILVKPDGSRLYGEYRY